MDYLVTAPQQLGQVLRGCRKQARLTQRDTADRGGLLPKTVSALESTPERASVETLFKILSALDLELVLRAKGAPAPPRARADW